MVVHWWVISARNVRRFSSRTRMIAPIPKQVSRIIVITVNRTGVTGVTDRAQINRGSTHTVPVAGWAHDDCRQSEHPLVAPPSVFTAAKPAGCSDEPGLRPSGLILPACQFIHALNLSTYGTRYVARRKRRTPRGVVVRSASGQPRGYLRRVQGHRSRAVRRRLLY